jgi:hypothetical protein
VQANQSLHRTPYSPFVPHSLSGAGEFSRYGAHAVVVEYSIIQMLPRSPVAGAARRGGSVFSNSLQGPQLVAPQQRSPQQSVAPGAVQLGSSQRFSVRAPVKLAFCRCAACIKATVVYGASIGSPIATKYK